MSAIRRAALLSAAVLLFAVASTAFAPPVARPPAPRPPAPTPRPPAPAGGGIAGKPGGAMGNPGGRIGGNIGNAGMLGGNAGGIRVPGGWGRTPQQVHGEIRSAINTRPSTAFSRLSGQDGHVLGESAKLALAREAVARVAILAEAGKHPVASLTEVRQAQSASKTLPAETRNSLAGIGQATERRVLAEGIETVQSKASAKQWGELGKAANEWLAHLNDGRLDLHREFESAEFRVRLVEVRDGLTQIRDLALRLEAVSAFESALAGKDGKPLAQIDRAKLPPKLARHLDCLRGSSELKGLASAKWTTAPDVASVKATVARFERGLIEVEGADVNLGKKLLQDLSVKALLSGHPETAIKLLPEGGSAEHAATLLRDLKALALGEGKVETWPAKSATSEPKASPAAPRPPPGLEPLLPEAARDGWRPPVKENGSGLPPLEQAAKVGEAIRTQTEQAASAEKQSTETKVAETNKKLTTLFEKVMAPELAERKKLVAVEAELDRRLKPAERVQVRTMLAAQKTTQQVVEELKAQPQTEDDENEFLAEVEKRLGVPLDDNQKAQAKRLRKQKRTVAEVAELLRR